MKTLYFFAFTLLTTFTQAQIVNIPDSNFKNALINYGVDTNNDGEIQVTEAEAIIGLDVFNQNIASLEGIQSFTNIVSLNCSNNSLTTLDLSQNLNLELLYVSNNQLTDLNIIQNLNLGAVFCNSNHLTNLDVSQNANLVQLQCYSNQLSTLDVTQNLNLHILFCNNNGLRNLDLSQNSNLRLLRCSENELTDLNLKNGNNQNIERIWAYENPNLVCIQIDDESATYPVCDMPNFIGWCKDETANYSQICGLGIENFSIS